MIDAEAISQTLENKSDDAHHKKRRKQLHTLRGIRGTPAGVLARVIDEQWKRNKPRLPQDADELHNLFCSAHEDGLVAVGLAAAASHDDPGEALALVDRWLPMVDDTETADALGWLLWGPAVIGGAGGGVSELLDGRQLPRPEQHRAAVAAAFAALPLPLEGPAAAGLRARLRQRRIAFVEEPVAAVVEPVAETYLSSSAVAVRKSVVRLLREYALWRPEEVVALLDRARGGVPRVVRAEVMRGVAKGRRRGDAKQTEEG